VVVVVAESGQLGDTAVSVVSSGLVGGPILEWPWLAGFDPNLVTRPQAVPIAVPDEADVMTGPAPSRLALVLSLEGWSYA
jgi:hypothetical protein